MRIIVVSFTFFPEVDGVANAAGQMVDFFVNAGHEVHVVTGSNRLPEAATNDRFEVHRFSVCENGEVDTSEAQSYIDFLIESRPAVTVFHCWSSWPIDIALKHISKIGGKKILLSHGYVTHTIYWHRRFPWGLWSWLQRLPEVFALPRQMASFDQIVFLSEKTDGGRFFDSWVARKLGHPNISVIPNAVNKSNWDKIPPDFKERHHMSDGTFFLCVANYSLRKNQLLALEAFCEAGIPGSSLVFVGSSLEGYGMEVRDKWISLKDSHSNIDVHFLEGLDRIEVISAIRSCDIFVLSATAETQPISLLEAMACGKPFISTDTGCVSEFKGGIVVSSMNGMVTEMQRLAASPGERSKIGKEGKECFDAEYSSPACKRAWLELIEKIA